MNTIRDNDLILYFYRDGLDAARIAEIDAALQVSEPLRARYADLRRRLDAAGAAPPIEADPGFEARLWRRLEQRIAAASPPRRSWADVLRDLLASLLSPRFGLAAAALLALAVGVGYYVGRYTNSSGPGVATTTPADNDRNVMAARVLDAYVASHLRATEGLLLTAANSDSAELAAGNSELASTLVESNRLYAAAAARAGNTRLADFLRQLEPVLIDLANQPADASIESRDGLRDYLRKTDLLFQVRATQARIDTAGKRKT